jgi:hypothetical protein
MVALLCVAAIYAVKDSIGGTVYLIETPYDAYMRVLALSRVILVVIAALIARKRSLTASDELLFWGIAGLSLDVFWQYAPPGPLFWFSAALAHGGIGFGVAQLIRYAAYDHPNPRLRKAATLSAAAIGATIAVAGFAVVALGFGSIGGQMLDQPTFLAIAPWLQRLRWLGMLAGCAAIEACAVSVLRSATPERRPRALLVVAGFAPLAITTSAHALALIVTGHDNVALRNADAVGNVLTAGALAYGALTRRLVDVEFYVSAAVAASLAGATLTILAFLSEHFLVPWIDERVQHLPFFAAHGWAVKTGAGLLAAFVAYFVLTRVYDEAAPFVRDAIFHHREEHLRAIRAFGETVATLDAARVAPALVEVVMRDAAASFAGLYRRDGNAFRLAYGSGNPQPAAQIATADGRVPASFAALVGADGSAAFATAMERQISGFLLSGPKRDATAYAPDELRALGLVAREAGLALSSRASS